MKPHTAPHGLWSADELQEILQHQMSADLDYDLANFSVAAGPMLAAARRAAAGVPHSFGDLLRSPSPLPDLLELVKDFAKAERESPDSPLPKEIATVLYYAAIGVALARCGARITALSDGDLRRGMAWCRRRAWIDERTDTLFRDALAYLSNEGTERA